MGASTTTEEKTPLEVQDNNSQNEVLTGRLAGYLPRMSGLRGKLIIPYVLLSLLLAMIGIFVVTRLVTSSLYERFINQIFEASRVTADGIVRQEQENLEELRFMAFYEGVPEALTIGNADALRDLLLPLMMNYNAEILTVVNLQGQEVLSLFQNLEGYTESRDIDLSSNPLIQSILEGYTDARGDKFVGVMQTETQMVLVTSAPVRDADGQLVGVLLIGSRLSDLLIEIKSQSLADIILLDSDHKLLITTLADPAEITGILELAGKAAAVFPEPQTQEIELYNRRYQVLFTPLHLREQAAGMLGVALPSSYVVSAEATSRNTFSIYFTLGTSLTILIGYILSQNIARPILRLRSLSQSVAAGDLDQTIGLRRADEIGDLAEAFDRMTSNLRERTAEAERLYAETVQRNIELAAINARLQETQLQLIQSEKLAAIGQLTAGIVHDVKNPLTVVKGTAELLQDEPELTDEMRKGLSLIRDSAVRANNIVSDLLKFARQAPPEMRPHDLRDTVQASVRLTTYLIRQARVQSQVELPEQPVMVSYDAQQIEQVFVNLIANAIQAMPNRGTLTVQLTQDEKTASIAFIDTGIGIPPEIIGRIFDPFFTTKPEGQGTGLGLSVSYGIVASHWGRIDVSSQVWQGTTFTVVLPLDHSTSSAGDV